MTIKPTTDASAATRRAEALRKQQAELKAHKVAAKPVKTSKISDGFSDSKLDEMKRIAEGMGKPEEKKKNGFDAKSGFDRPVVSADGISGGASIGAELKAGPVTVGLSWKATAAVAHGTEDGMTTTTVSGSLTGTASGSIKAGSIGISGSISAGDAASYSVSMPEAVAVDPLTVNPFDPSTMPTGTVVKLEESSFTETKMGAAFQALSVSSGVKQGEGMSIAIEKTGDTTVRVTAGPTDMVDASMRLGVGMAGVSVGLGARTELDYGKMNTAEFDLATPEGAAAYAAFVEHGTLPSEPGPGVSGVTTVETLSMDSTASLDARMGDERFVISENSNSGVRTRTTLPDGTSTETGTLQYGESSPLEITRAFDADGTERIDERKYAFEMVVDEYNVETVNAILGAEGVVKPGETATITFTEQQMAEYLEKAQAAVATSRNGGAGFGTARDEALITGASTPLEFAAAFASAGNDATRLDWLTSIADGADGRFDARSSPIDASLGVK